MTTTTVRGLTVTASQNLITETCCNCGMLFAMTDDFRAQRLRDHKSFYCPSGHSQSYVGETEEQKLARQLRNAQAQATAARDQLSSTREDLAHTERRLASQRGVTTRLKNRIAAGVCPCCNRQFQNLHRHMTGQHPDFTTPERNAS